MGTAPFGMGPLFQHQEHAARTGDDAATFRAAALPHRRPGCAVQVAAQFIGQQHVGMFAIVGSADQRMGGLTGTDAGDRHVHGGDAGAFFAHEGA